MKSWYQSLLCLVSVILVIAAPASAESVLFKNVRVFDGIDPTLLKASVLVEGDKITKISSRSIDVPEGTIVIEGNNRVLSPGFWGQPIVRRRSRRMSMTRVIVMCRLMNW